MIKYPSQQPVEEKPVPLRVIVQEDKIVLSMDDLSGFSRGQRRTELAMCPETAVMIGNLLVAHGKDLLRLTLQQTKEKDNGTDTSIS